MSVGIDDRAGLPASETQSGQQATGLRGIRSIILRAIHDERRGLDILRRIQNRTRSKRVIPAACLRDDRAHDHPRLS